MRMKLDPRNPELRRIVLNERKNPRIQFMRAADNLARGAAAQSGNKTGSSAGGGGYNDEAAQDAVGAMIVDTATIDLTYTDATPELKADVKANSVDVTLMHATQTDVLFGRSTAAAGAGEEIACTAAGRAILDDANAAAQLATLGAQPLDADLTALAGLASTAGMLARTGAGAFAVRTLTAGSGIAVLNGDGQSTNPVIATAGNLPLNVRTLTGSDTITTADCVVLITLSGATAATLTLPAVSNAGCTLFFRRTDLDFTSSCTIDPAGAEQWEGTASDTFSLGVMGVVTIASDGTSWWILSQS